MNATYRWLVIALTALSAASLAAPVAAEETTDEEEATPAPAPPEDLSSYRFLSYPEEQALERAIEFDGNAFLDCRDGLEDVPRREREVTNRVPFTLIVLADGTVTARYDGDDDADGEIQECLLEELGDMELEPADSAYASSRYRWRFYDHNYYDRRRTRHAEMIALYTLGGVTAGTAVGMFVAAGNDEDDMDERTAGISPGPALDRLEDRPRRFRTAGYVMTGVSVVSFVSAAILTVKNRQIENAENPVLVLSPGAPTGDLGFTFTSRF